VDLRSRGLYTRFWVVNTAQGVLRRGISPSGAARRKELTFMGEDNELDVDELARQLSYSASETTPAEDSNGMSRRELLKRGGVGAVAVAGLGGLAGPAAAATSKAGKFTGTLRVITLGVEFPTPEVAKRMQTDLGFSVALTPTDP